MPGGGMLGGGGHGVGGGTGLHAFDTGALRPQRTLVRNHVVARLGQLLKTDPGGKGYINRISGLPRPLRQLNAEDFQLVLQQLQSQVPAILVALGSKSYESEGLRGREWRGELEVEVYAISSHQRSFIAGRLEQDAIATGNANADPGIETMLEHIEERLIGQHVSVRGGYELRPKHEDEVATSPEYTMWSQTYVVWVDRSINPHRDVTAIVTDVQVTNINGPIPTSSDPSGPLPTPENPTPDNLVVVTDTVLEAP